MPGTINIKVFLLRQASGLSSQNLHVFPGGAQQTAVSEAIDVSEHISPIPGRVTANAGVIKRTRKRKLVKSRERTNRDCILKLKDQR
jgi:hypothetical protein